MARTRYKQKPLFWWCIQYTGSNATEITDFCYLCTVENGVLMFNGFPIATTDWILEDQSGQFSMMIDQQFHAFFSLDAAPVGQPAS